MSRLRFLRPSTSRRAGTLTAVALSLGAGLTIAKADKMYWGSYDSGPPGKLHRANLDGTGVEDLKETSAWGVALDVASGHVYWTVGGSGSKGIIYRGGMNGPGMVVPQAA